MSENTEAESMKETAEQPRKPLPSAATKPYAPPRLEYVGLMTEIVQSGNGKASSPAPDGPDIRKPPGQPG